MAPLVTLPRLAMSRMDVWMYPSSENSSTAKSMSAVRVASALSAVRRGLPSVSLLLIREVSNVAAQDGDDACEVAQFSGAEVDAVANVGDGLGAPASELPAGRKDAGQGRPAVGGVGIAAHELLFLELVDQLRDSRGMDHEPVAD